MVGTTWVEGARSVLETVFGDGLKAEGGGACLITGLREVNGAWRTGLTDALSVTTFALAGA